MQTFVYTINGETPGKKNENRFNLKGVSFKSDRFREWHRNALRTLRFSQRPASPLQCARIRIEFFHSDLRRRDGDNSLASIQDLLQDANIIVDDNWTRIGTPEVLHDVFIHPYCRITVEETEPVDWEGKVKAMRREFNKRNKENLKNGSR